MAKHMQNGDLLFFWYNIHRKLNMSANKSQIVVYNPNETVRLDVRLEKCCQCENVVIY